MDPSQESTAASVPTMVDRALRRRSAQWAAAMAMPRDTHDESAARADRLAELCDREARWWSVLASWTYRHSDLPVVFGRAVLGAIEAAEARALTWRELAAEWRRIEAGESSPCDECGVAA